MGFVNYIHDLQNISRCNDIMFYCMARYKNTPYIFESENMKMMEILTRCDYEKNGLASMPRLHE